MLLATSIGAIYGFLVGGVGHWGGREEGWEAGWEEGGLPFPSVPYSLPSDGCYGSNSGHMGAGPLGGATWAGSEFPSGHLLGGRRS